MDFKRTFAVCVIFLVAAGSLSASGSSEMVQESDEPLFLQYNLWYEDSGDIFAINFKRGDMIPAGTRVVSIVPVKKKYEGFRFRLEGDASEYVLLFSSRWQPAMTSDLLFRRTFGTQDLAALTADFSDRDRELLRRGEVETGLSREQVQVIWGYPLAKSHRSNLETRAEYHQSRFNRVVLYYDENDVVEEIVD